MMKGTVSGKQKHTVRLRETLLLQARREIRVTAKIVTAQRLRGAAERREGAADAARGARVKTGPLDGCVRLRRKSGLTKTKGKGSGSQIGG